MSQQMFDLLAALAAAITFPSSQHARLLPCKVPKGPHAPDLLVQLHRAPRTAEPRLLPRNDESCLQRELIANGDSTTWWDYWRDYPIRF